MIFKIVLLDLEVQLHPSKLSTDLRLWFYFLRYELLKVLAMPLKFLFLILSIMSPKELGRSQNVDLEVKEISNRFFFSWKSWPKIFLKWKSKKNWLTKKRSIFFSKTKISWWQKIWIDNFFHISKNIFGFYIFEKYFQVWDFEKHFDILKNIFRMFS